MEEDFEILTEKYRPKTLDEVVGQPHIIPFLKGFAKNKKLPHMLFVGPPGVGKTSVAIALARDIFGSDWRTHFLELNASDDRGIDVVRQKIKNYAKAIPAKYNYKIIFLDEADALTRDAQPALRRIIENTSSTCRFILSCNYPQRLINPIKDRLVEFRFKRLSYDAMKAIIRRVIENEGLEMTPSAISVLISLSRGSLRKAFNILSSFKAAGITTITENALYEAVNPVDSRFIEALVNAVKSGDLITVDKHINNLLYNRAYDPAEILAWLYDIIEANESIPPKTKLKILMKIGDFEYRISMGASPDLQLKTLMANILYLLSEVYK